MKLHSPTLYWGGGKTLTGYHCCYSMCEYYLRYIFFSAFTCLKPMSRAYTGYECMNLSQSEPTKLQNFLSCTIAFRSSILNMKRPVHQGDVQFAHSHMSPHIKTLTPINTPIQQSNPASAPQ